MKRVKVILSCYLLLSSFLVRAQCSDVLYDANYMSQQGKIDAAISLLEECIHTLDNKEDKFEGYRLLAILYTERLNDTKRDRNIEKLLQLKPDYQYQPSNDPSEFRRALSKYRVEPFIQVGLKFGSNTSMPRVKENFSQFSYAQSIVRKGGFQAGITAFAHIAESYVLSSDLMLKGVRFSKETTSNNWEQLATERFRMMQFSTAFSRTLWERERISFDAGLLGGIDFLTSSDVNIISRYTVSPTEEIYSTNTLKAKNRLQFYGGICGTFSYLLPKGALAIDIQYHLYAKNLTDPDQRYSQGDFIYASEYVSDDVKLRVAQFNLRYSLPLTYKVIRNN
ncbi:MAG: hypothetical protein H6606_03880 [Flavobacteriales bacterium]|nr:hypothetical protein [Flavobacteriales bacterium]